MSAKTALAVVESAPTSASASSETIAGQLETEQAAHATAVARLEELAAERQELLLGDDDNALAEHDELIAATERKRDRHEARAAKFRAELEEAEQREANEAKWDRYRAVERQCAEAREWMEAEYAKLATALTRGLAALKAADQAAERMNAHYLPTGAERLQLPSHSRHVAVTDDRREIRKVQRWVSSQGHPLSGVQLIDGKPGVPGARFVEVEEEVTVTGNPGWRPAALYDAVGELPGLGRRDPAFWPKD